MVDVTDHLSPTKSAAGSATTKNSSLVSPQVSVASLSSAFSYAAGAATSEERPARNTLQQRLLRLPIAQTAMDPMDPVEVLVLVLQITAIADHEVAATEIDLLHHHRVYHRTDLLEAAMPDTPNNGIKDRIKRMSLSHRRCIKGRTV